MSRMEALDGRSELRAHLARTNRGGSLLEAETRIPSKVRPIPPLVSRLGYASERSKLHIPRQALASLLALAFCWQRARKVFSPRLTPVRCRLCLDRRTRNKLPNNYKN